MNGVHLRIQHKTRVHQRIPHRRGIQQRTPHKIGVQQSVPHQGGVYQRIPHKGGRSSVEDPTQKRVCNKEEDPIDLHNTGNQHRIRYK
jgi:hypothetical protein